MTDIIKNTIEVGCPPETMYEYVTQPWLWHEWHPNSRSATAASERLSEGDSFDEVIELQPLSPLPITLTKYPHYSVIAATPGKHWRVEGTMKGGWLQIDYQFEPQSAACLLPEPFATKPGASPV